MGITNFATFSDAFTVAKSTGKNVVVCKIKEGPSKRGGPFFLLPLEKFNSKGTSASYTPEACIIAEILPAEVLSKPSFEIFKRSEDYRTTYRRR